jgi:hypothetical protein
MELIVVNIRRKYDLGPKPRIPAKNSADSSALAWLYTSLFCDRQGLYLWRRHTANEENTRLLGRERTISNLILILTNTML